MERLMDKEKWTKEAGRWAKHAYCYEGMVDEFPEFFDDDVRAAGIDPYDAVDQFAESNELDRADGFYGINSDKSFHKLWPTGGGGG
jgi:hypothetical protein